jgi:hypothetical protein
MAVVGLLPPHGRERPSRTQVHHGLRRQCDPGRLGVDGDDASTRGVGWMRLVLGVGDRRCDRGGRTRAVLPASRRRTRHRAACPLAASRLPSRRPRGGVRDPVSRTRIREPVRCGWARRLHTVAVACNRRRVRRRRVRPRGVPSTTILVVGDARTAHRRCRAPPRDRRRHTGARTSARWFRVAILVGTVVCGVIVLSARSTYACPAGEECEPVTWASWTWAGIALVGLWFLAVGMGYALRERFRCRLLDPSRASTLERPF